MNRVGNNLYDVWLKYFVRFEGLGYEGLKCSGVMMTLNHDVWRRVVEHSAVMTVSGKVDMRLLSVFVCWSEWLFGCERLLGWKLPLLQLSFTSSPNCPPAVNLTKHGGVCWWSAVGTRSAMWCQADKNSLAQQETSGYFFLFPFGEMVSGVQYINYFLMCFAPKNVTGYCSSKQEVHVALCASIIETSTGLHWNKAVNMHNVVYLDYCFKKGVELLICTRLMTSLVLFRNQYFFKIVFIRFHLVVPIMWDGWGWVSITWWSETVNSS